MRYKYTTYSNWHNYKYYFGCIFLFAFLYCSAQSKLKVTIAGSGGQPLSQVQVFCKGKFLGKTNSLGELEFKTTCLTVEVKRKGYFPEDIIVDRTMEIAMELRKSNSGRIEKIKLKDESDPKALAILKKVNENYSINRPSNLETYAYKSYERMSFDMDADTVSFYKNYIKQRRDSLRDVASRVSIPPKDAKTEKDSLEQVRLMSLLAESKIFLWERVIQYLYTKKHGEKVKVLDNRIAGLNEPIYEMIPLRTNRDEIPHEVQEHNRNLYRYFLTDTLEMEGRKNYVIRFRPTNMKSLRNQRRFTGYLYVDMATYGIKKIESHSKERYLGSLTSIWVPINGKWFLKKENLKLRAGKLRFSDNRGADYKNKTFGYYVYRTADYFDHQTPVEIQDKEFKGYTMEVINYDGSRLQDFRTFDLSTREQQTYAKIDSVGSKYNFSGKIKFFSSLIKGKIRTGKLDWDVAQLAKYNLYEGIRLGLNPKGNENLHPYISPDAYLAYGLKDQKLKIGFGLDLKTTLRKNSFFRIEYVSDVMAAGRFNENLWNFRMKFMNAGVDLKNDHFYRFKGLKFSFENDFSNSLTMRLSTQYLSEKALFYYSFGDNISSFQNTSALLTLKYAPKSKNIMTPSGKYTYDQGFPELYFNLQRSFKRFGGDFSFTKMDILFNHRFKSQIGITGWRSYSGILLGQAPVWHHFTMNGLVGRQSNTLNYNLTSYLGFATMQTGKYYADYFTGYYLTHRLPWYFKSVGQNTSSIDIVYRGIIGGLNKNQWHDPQLETLRHLYQEIGVEWNNFLSSQFNLGFFYRVGHYQTSNFKDNFALQFKFKFLGF